MTRAASTIRYSGNPLDHPFPGIPQVWPATMRQRAATDLELIAEHVPGFAEHIAHADPDADVEDFWEDAARAAGALRAAHSVGAEFVLATGQTVWPRAQLDERLGQVARGETPRHGIDPLIAHRVLHEAGGRWMALAGVGEEGELAPEHDLIELIRTRADAGVRRLVIKVAPTKSGITILDVHPGMSRQDVHTLLLDDDQLGWTLIHYEGRPRAFLLQDWIPMSFEYRLFLVDGHVVSGAGCIEEHTPYDRPRLHATFDDRMRTVRTNSIADIDDEDHRIVHDPELVARYRHVGQQLARLYGLSTIVLDLAYDSVRDEVVVVELNDLPNSGLYAANADAIQAALARAVDRGYGQIAPVS